jgi:hypothetical protein
MRFSSLITAGLIAGLFFGCSEHKEKLIPLTKQEKYNADLMAYHSEATYSYYIDNIMFGLISGCNNWHKFTFDKKSVFIAERDGYYYSIHSDGMLLKSNGMAEKIEILRLTEKQKVKIVKFYYRLFDFSNSKKGVDVYDPTCS